MITMHQTTSARLAASVDHRSGHHMTGRPADSYRRVERAAVRPNYLARRVGALGGVVASLFAVVQITAAAVAFVGASPALAAGSEASVSTGIESSQRHVAQDGDSLWSIAELHRGETPRSVYIDQLIELNGGTAIRAGAAVLLP